MGNAKDKYIEAFRYVTKLQVITVSGNRKGEHWIDSLRGNTD